MSKEYVKNVELPESLMSELKASIANELDGNTPTKFVRKILGVDDDREIKYISYSLARALRGDVNPADLKWLDGIASIEVIDKCARFFLRHHEKLPAKTEEELLMLANYKNQTKEEKWRNDLMSKMALVKAWGIGG